ncbi:MAG: tRNA (adenosine(37)-N6)-threonylcarbamoyltransferase complex transferase subunit TsaD [Candidatus Uhrbacteria bacterium]
MRILGIESSCDETAIAIVSGNGDDLVVEKSLIASQAALHAKYGGVVPEVAAREHIDAIFPLLLESGIPRDGSGIDAIAVTSGPGLVPALRVGVELAKTLAWAWGKPLVGANHLEGHLYSTFKAIEFPALALLVSGGHTEIVLMKDHGVYERVGATRDDAAGEAFDKVAKLLGLGYPGGPIVSKMASQGSATAIAFPRPMMESHDFNFSFSGLKTAVAVRRRENPDDRVEDVCASFQAAVVDVLVAKTMRAVEQYGPKCLILAGGVSANKALRQGLSTAISNFQFPISFLSPDLALTGDNAAMIAAAGYYHAMRGDFVDPLTLVADPNMELV